MESFLQRLFHTALRLVLVASGVLVFLGLLAAALVLAAVWGVLRLWARLTGRPVMPWVLAAWQRTRPMNAWRGTWQDMRGGSAPDGQAARTRRPFAQGPLASAPSQGVSDAVIVDENVRR